MTTTEDLQLQDGTQPPAGFAMVWRADLDTDVVRGLTGAAFRVWVALGAYASRGSGAVWPTRATLAALLGVNRRTVQKALEQLVRVGLVERHDDYPQRLTLRSARLVRGCPTGHGGAPEGTGGALQGTGGVPHRAPKENSEQTTQQTNTSQASPAAQLLLEPQERGVPPWELLRQQVVVEHGRESASRWVPSKGLGKQLALILRRTGSLEAAQKLLRLAYTSQEFVHQRNRERGGGHPPLDTLARHGVRYLEAAVDWQPPRLAGEYQRPADTPPPRELTEAEWQAEMADWDAWAAKRGA